MSLSRGRLRYFDKLFWREQPLSQQLLTTPPGRLHFKILLKLHTQIMKYIVLCLWRGGTEVCSCLMRERVESWVNLQGFRESPYSRSLLLQRAIDTRNPRRIEVWIGRDLHMLLKWLMYLQSSWIYLTMLRVGMERKVRRRGDTRRRDELQEEKGKRKMWCRAK